MSHEVVDSEIGHILSANRSLIPGDVQVIKCDFRSCLFDFFGIYFTFYAKETMKDSAVSLSLNEKKFNLADF